MIVSLVYFRVLGIRDRHFDNILVRQDGTMYHIGNDIRTGPSAGLGYKFKNLLQIFEIKNQNFLKLQKSQNF